MATNLSIAEAVLRSDRRLRPIYDEKYELSFETASGRQIAINRQASATAVRLWIENTFDPTSLMLSERATIKFYPATRPRAHLSANRLTGPYKMRKGNDCWYIAVTTDGDLRTVLEAYLAS